MGNYTSKEDEEFFGAIGRLVITWGHLEIGLDCVVAIMYHGFNGKQIEPEIPRALKRKITFLRAAIDKLPIPQDGKDGYHSLFDKIEEEAETRHDIIHGVVIDYAEHSGEATMVRALRHKAGVTKKEFKITTKDILRAAVTAQRLSGKTLRWATEFYELIDKLSKQRDEQKPS